jgi:hypothetical protein
MADWEGPTVEHLLALHRRAQEATAEDEEIVLDADLQEDGTVSAYVAVYNASCGCGKLRHEVEVNEIRVFASREEGEEFLEECRASTARITSQFDHREIFSSLDAVRIRVHAPHLVKAARP